MKLSNIEFTAFVGLDWANAKHDICVQAAGCQTASYGLGVQTMARNLLRSRAYRASCPTRTGQSLDRRITSLDKPP